MRVSLWIIYKPKWGYHYYLLHSVQDGSSQLCLYLDSYNLQSTDTWEPQSKAQVVLIIIEIALGEPLSLTLTLLPTREGCLLGTLQLRASSGTSEPSTLPRPEAEMCRAAKGRRSSTWDLLSSTIWARNFRTGWRVERGKSIWLALKANLPDKTFLPHAAALCLPPGDRPIFTHRKGEKSGCVLAVLLSPRVKGASGDVTICFHLNSLSW